MENNHELVTEVTENTVEQPVEEVVEGIELTDTTETKEEDPVVEETKEVEQVRTYTDKEVDDIVARKLAKQESRLRRDMEKELVKYKNTESVLNAGLGTSSIDEANKKLREAFEEQGIKLPTPNKPELSEREIEILAKAEADDIIDLGIEEMTKEANLLASKGYQNLSNKEKVVFNTLAERLKTEQDKAELVKIGVKADVLEDKEFQEFRKDFASNAPITKVYELYNKTKPKPEVKQIGSMASTETNKVKDFYTYEEMKQLTPKDYEDPRIMKAVELSLQKLYKEGH